MINWLITGTVGFLVNLLGNRPGRGVLEGGYLGHKLYSQCEVRTIAYDQYFILVCGPFNFPPCKYAENARYDEVVCNKLPVIFSLFLAPHVSSWKLERRFTFTLFITLCLGVIYNIDTPQRLGCYFSARLGDRITVMLGFFEYYLSSCPSCHSLIVNWNFWAFYS